MLQGYYKFRLPDKSKKNDFYAEVNWKEDESIESCQIIRFTFPDGKQAYLERKLLNEMLFAIGRKEDQRKMIPQKMTRVRWYETVVSVKAKKDIHKGENITFPIKISLPSVEEEVISEIKKSVPDTKSGIQLWKKHF